jgi:hypothetical protein
MVSEYYLQLPFHATLILVAWKELLNKETSSILLDGIGKGKKVYRIF